MRYYKIGQQYERKRRWPYPVIVFILFVSVVTVIPGNDSKNTVSPIIKSDVAGLQLSQPLPASTLPIPQFIPQLDWPEYGQSAYGVMEEGVLAQSNKSFESVPIASLTKVITALVILDKKPLAQGEQGPTITLSSADEELYREYVRKSGTVVPVKNGTEMSQYQAMQAMLLSSANNIADTLVVWVFGSMEEYTVYANNWLRENQFTKTLVGDASGYSSLSVSTAEEMVQLGFLYVKEPVLLEIAKQTEANIPFAGRIPSYNSGINEGNIIGLKTGYTDEARSTFLAASISGNNNDEISVTAVLGATDRYTAEQDAKSILLSGDSEHALFEKAQP